MSDRIFTPGETVTWKPEAIEAQPPDDGTGTIMVPGDHMRVVRDQGGAIVDVEIFGLVIPADRNTIEPC